MNSSPELLLAAQKLVAEGQRNNVNQVHEIVLRDVDAYQSEEKLRVLTLIPIGEVVGVAIHPANRKPTDAEILFISVHALGSSLPALGFRAGTAIVQTQTLIHPQDSA